MKFFEPARLIGLSMLFLGLLGTAQAQQAERCGHQHALDRLYERQPDARASVQAAEQAVEAYLQQPQAQLRVEEDIIYIPTVVHVVYKTAVQNISDEQVFSQIDVLNEDFARLNVDWTSLRADFTSLAADTRIQFCLAEKNPLGVPSNGIVRKETGKNSFNDSDTMGWDGVKMADYGGSDAWPRNDYLNIWVCNLDPTSGVLGYAYPPGVASWQDGVVINFRFFGRVGVLTPPFNRGRTTTHEVGHWLGLRHIWGDGGCGIDDGIDDTPAAGGPNFGCPLATTASCGSLDLWENFMDYTDDRCMVMFTEGQGDRMRAILNSVRSTIPVSPKCYFNTAIEEIPGQFMEDLLLYPNPLSGQSLQLSWTATQTSAEALIRVFDATGRMVASMVEPSGSGTAQLALSGLPNGIYMLQLSQDGRDQVKRFVIAR